MVERSRLGIFITAGPERPGQDIGGSEKVCTLSYGLGPSVVGRNQPVLKKESGIGGRTGCKKKNKGGKTTAAKGRKKSGQICKKGISIVTGFLQ